MAYRLKMAKIRDILALHQQGWSFRKIARHLGIHRDTVAGYVAAGGSKPAKAPPGSESTRSDCEAYREQILDKLEQGLSAKRIHQDLVDEAGFFVGRLGSQQPLPFRRLEKPAGQEAQVDFGTGAWVLQPGGRKKRTHVFRIVLSHSRKAYSEVVYRQTTDNFIRCLENAFWHFGGSPETLVIDNLRAAVKKTNWFEPELNPKLRSFCEHYGVVILPTRPAMPRHKGNVEKGIDYVQDNALKGRQFETLQQQNLHLMDWEASIADTRIHGTTRKQVGKVFREVEQPLLKMLRAVLSDTTFAAWQSQFREGPIAGRVGPIEDGTAICGDGGAW